ncbi:hypothetical protein VTN96DRAFT_6519 [Rasamsonia emersonii]
MRSFVYTIITILTSIIHQITVSAINVGRDDVQPWQRLADALNISDYETLSALQRAVRGSSNGTHETEKAQEACSISQAVFKGKLISPQQSTLYTNRTETNWSDNCWQNASCIVSPESAQDVARIMTIITFTQTTFAVRSGGHDFNVNHSSVGRNGILVDMANFNNITLSADKSTVTIGVGARWGDVYNALNGSGVSVNGARSPNPGVGGQTLGGGIGWFSNLAGVSAASVIAAEVVLANSTIVRASQESHPELLWALKGGGPNYGIVTSFTYRTLPIDKMWFEARLYTRDKNQQLLNALVAYQEMASNDSKANIVYQLSENTTAPQSFVGFLYLDPVEYPSVFSPFYDIPHTVNMIDSTIGTLADLSSMYNDPQYPQTPPSRDYVVSLPHRVDNATYQESYAAFTTYAEQAFAAGWTMNYGSQPISTNAVQASSDTPLNLTLVDQDWVHVTIEWYSAEDDAQAMGLIRSMGQSIAMSASQHGSDLAYRFMNDAYDGQAVLSSYGAGNMEKLWKISQAYDPEGVFQRLQNGGWLLSREVASMHDAR